MDKPRARILLFASLVIFSIFVHHRSRTAQAAEMYDWLDKISEAKYMLHGMKLKHNAKAIVYKEIIKPPSQNKNKKSKAITIKRTDYAWKEAGLALMNTKTGEIVLVKIKKEGRISKIMTVDLLWKSNPE